MFMSTEHVTFWGFAAATGACGYQSEPLRH